LLLAGDHERALEIRSRFRSVPFWRLQCEFAGNAIDLGFPPSFLRFFNRGNCLLNVAPGIAKLAELNVTA
jgi:hypothetical protein